VDSGANLKSVEAGEPGDLLEYLVRVAGRITAQMIMTQRKRLVCASPTMSVGQALELMGSLYDQLPVLDGERFVGLAFKRDLLTRSSAVPVSEAAVPLNRVPCVQPETPLRNVTESLLHYSCVAVVEGTEPKLCGLIHFSDLNGHPARSNLYLWISSFEMTLAELVRRELPDYREWLKTLDEHRQVLILGRREYERRQNIELDPVESVELSDLLRIIRAAPRVLDQLGFTKSQFDRKTGHLVKLRNGVMHPVRSLIRRHEDMQKLAEVFSDLREVLEAVRRVLATPSADTCRAEPMGG